jgi:hypothetical protein
MRILHVALVYGDSDHHLPRALNPQFDSYSRRGFKYGIRLASLAY